MFCAIKQDWKGLRTFLDFGVDMEAVRRHDGKTLLIEVTAKGSFEIVQYMVNECAANIHARDKVSQLFAVYVIFVNCPVNNS